MKLYEYVEPQISHVYPAVGGQFGGGTVTIAGQFLGIDVAKPTITIGQQVCVGTKIVVPGKKLTCTVPVDNGPIGKTDVVVSVNGVKSNTTDFAKFEYVQAEVTRVEPKEGPTYGNIEMTLTGHMLGIHSVVPKVFIGALQCTNVVLVSESQIKCTHQRAVPVMQKSK